jgi:AcrR family transcriptional regulator
MLISHQPAVKDREGGRMPAPEKTTREAIVAAGRELVEQGGLEGLTMQAVADRVGVRAPSLYKRVRNRGELLELVVGATVEDLAARLEATAVEPDPRRRIVAQADQLRRFAHDRPVGFALVFGAHGAPRPQPSTATRSVSPLLDAVAELTGPEHALDGARLVTAWANGFITMELGDALRMGGDVDAAWRWGLDRIVTALGTAG